MIYRLHLALLLYCDYMFLVIVIFTWHSLKEKLLVKKCQEVYYIATVRIHSNLIRKKVVTVDGCWMKSSGEIKFRLFR